ncbi:hypothetical protein BDZ94DRAFT_1274196 [Collybia nuda]|uniref:Uncharacterized protein n=1 Tax=Collybia nuda TaxID=64659 RepID=A0A9P5XUH7_9AGAR|nr:hypothetical protein BDZ94DRAFT_1274196 [Collybia nuda]
MTDTLDIVTLALSSATPSTTVLQAALKTCQLELQNARHQIRQLQLENEALKAVSSLSTSSSHRSSEAPAWIKASILVPFRQDIITCSKKLAAMEEFWGYENAFLRPYPNQVPTIRERYESVEAYTQYVTSLLYMYFPTNLHPSIENLVAFKDAVLCQSSEFRSTLVSNARKGGPVIYSGLDILPECWQRSCSRQKEPSCLQLLTWNADAKPLKYDLYPPILHLDVSRKSSPLFYNSALIKTARLTLFGSTALAGDKLSTNSSGMKWGLLKTTSGLIAGSASIVTFLLSGDQVFEPMGKFTGINYSWQFYKRKQLLDETAHEESTQALFRYWDKHVFAGAPHHVHQPTSISQPTNTPTNAIDEQEEARRAFVMHSHSEESDGEIFEWPQDTYTELDMIGDTARETHSSISSSLHTPSIPSPTPAMHGQLHASNSHITRPPSPEIYSALTAISAHSATTRRSTRSPLAMGTMMAFTPTISTSKPVPDEPTNPEISHNTTQDPIPPIIEEPTMHTEAPAPTRGRGRGGRGRGKANHSSSDGIQVPVRATRSQKV